MKLRPISAGALSGTATLQCPTGVFGGCLISTDGTNAAVVVARDNDATGKVVFSISTISAGPYHAPYKMQGDGSLYVSVTGTGASAMFYEWMGQ